MHIAAPPPSSPSLNTSSTKQSPEGAAARVFAIPELLEEILFIAFMDQFKDGYTTYNLPICISWHRSRKLQTCLIALQRVNTSFRATILGSPKLRRLIYLEPGDNRGVQNISLKHEPVFWLLNYILERSGGDTLDWVDDTGLERAEYDGTVAKNTAVTQEEEHVPVIRVSVARSVIEFATAQEYRRNSVFSKLTRGLNWGTEGDQCWRKIAVCNSFDPTAIVIRLEVTAHPDLPLPKNLAVLTDLRFEADDTLDDVFQSLCGFFKVIDRRLKVASKTQKEFAKDTLALLNGLRRGV